MSRDARYERNAPLTLTNILHPHLAQALRRWLLDAITNISRPHLAQVLYYLSGLTCTDENFIQKAGAMRTAAARGVALVAPDTSPRGADVAGEVRFSFPLFRSVPQYNDPSE